MAIEANEVLTRRVVGGISNSFGEGHGVLSKGMATAKFAATFEPDEFSANVGGNDAVVFQLVTQAKMLPAVVAAQITLLDEWMQAEGIGWRELVKETAKGTIVCDTKALNGAPLSAAQKKTLRPLIVAYAKGLARPCAPILPTKSQMAKPEKLVDATIFADADVALAAQRAEAAKAATEAAADTKNRIKSIKDAIKLLTSLKGDTSTLEAELARLSA